MSCPCLTLPARLVTRRGYFCSEPPARGQVGRIVVLACHWIGDTFWAMQTVPVLRQTYPDAQLHVALKAHSAELFNGIVDAGHLHVTPHITSDRHREQTSLRGLLANARTLRRLQPDLVIDLTGNRYSALATLLIRPRWSVGFDGGLLGSLYSHRVSMPADVHLADRPFHVIRPLVEDVERPPELQPPRPRLSFDDECRRLGLDPDRPVALVAPGAGWPEKEWSPQGFSDICKVLVGRGVQVVVNGSPKQDALCRQVAADARVDDQPDAVLAVDTGSIPGLIALLSGAGLVVANDSAVGHIAAAFGCPTISLFVDDTYTVEQAAPIGPRVHVFDGNKRRFTTDEVVTRVLEVAP